MTKAKNKGKTKKYPLTAPQLDTILYDHLFRPDRRDLPPGEDGIHRIDGELTDLGEYFYRGDGGVPSFGIPAPVVPQRVNGDSAAVADSFAVSEGATAAGASFPPTDNMGGLKYRKNENDLIRGGFDGGMTLGFSGQWHNSRKFSELIETLDEIKLQYQESEETMNPAKFTVELCGRTWTVHPTAAREGLVYKYVLEGGGIRLLIHSNPKKVPQPIRVRFGFDALFGRNAYYVHDEFIGWLYDLGFLVDEDENGQLAETLGRVDLQVLIFSPMEEFLKAFSENRVVTRSKKRRLITNGDHLETITLGTEIELCIYDKRAELTKLSRKAKEADKCIATVANSIGEEIWYDSDIPITRVEFRLMNGSILREYGIRTMDDLMNSESALVEWLTLHWFRILDNPKVRGHENRAALSPLWEEVRELFHTYFPGVEGERPILNRRHELDREPFVKGLKLQAMGCLRNAAAVVLGMCDDPQEYIRYIFLQSSKKLAW